MQTHQLSRKARHHILIFMLVSGVITWTAVITNFADPRSGPLHANVAQQPRKVRVSIDDPRPVAKAIITLEAKYRSIITYEDPRYVNADDIVDVTATVRRDLTKYSPGMAPKVLVPKGGELSFEYDETIQKEAVLRQLLRAQSVNGNSGRFRMEEGPGVIHIIPTAIKDRSGKLVSNKPVLDTLINLPAENRTGLQALEALCTAISKANQTRVIIGSIPIGLFLRQRDEKGASRQRAREVLFQLLQRMSNGTKLSWQLFYDPGMKIYALNIHIV